MGEFISSDDQDMDGMVEFVGKIMEELKGNEEERVNQIQGEIGELIPDSITASLSV